MDVVFMQTVKAKLLVAVCLFVGLNVVVGTIGWRGFSNTEQAVKLLRDESLPDIGRAMELAKRSSAVAAIAPFISSIQVVNKLNDESVKLDGQLAELNLLVSAVEAGNDAKEGAEKRKAGELARKLEADLHELVRNTRQSLDIRSDILELRYAFDGRGRIENRIRDIGAQFPPPGRLQSSDVFRNLVETIFEGMGTSSPATLRGLENTYNRSAKQFYGDLDRISDATSLAGIAEIRQFVDAQAGVFELRRRELAALQKRQYLLASIHAVSTELSNQVADIVGRTTQMAQSRSSETNAALVQGKGGIFPLTLISVLVGAVTAFYVLRNLAGNLAAVTTAMTRLSQGDRTINVPAVDRSDEFGSLARAFNVFKEQSFDREALANDLIEKSQTLEATFANMTDGMSVFNSDGRLVAFNPQFVEINELDPQAIRQGVHFDVILAELRKSGVKARFTEGATADPDALFQQRTREAIRYEQTFASGRIVELKSHPMPGGFTTIYTDLTEQRAIERQLRQSQRMEAVGQLTSGMAHDFNNLLAAVSGNLQMLYQTLHESPDVAQKILRALEAAERGATVTQRLLAFSRQQALQPEATDLNSLVLNLLDLASYSLGSKIAVETTLQAGLVSVFVDPGQLENAILNLLFNSRDAMPAGGMIRVRTAEMPPEAGNGFIGICIEDNGIGMTPEVLAQVYEPFFTTKDKGRGSGLGLSMVYGFVTQSGGQIDISSTPGAGTTVSILLPKAHGRMAVRNHWPAGAGAPVVGGHEHLLLVEDDPIVRETVVEMLGRLGYRTRVAADVGQARAALEAEAFDLLFTDVMLPGGLTGVDIADYARTLQPGIAVLYTSGHPRDRLNDSLTLGSDVRLLGKPYRVEALATALRALLDARQSSPIRSTEGLNR
jgi:signal transduction histidine kinase/ActR/RegA family two-component response regulator